MEGRIRGELKKGGGKDESGKEKKWIDRKREKIDLAKIRTKWEEGEEERG